MNLAASSFMATINEYVQQTMEQDPSHLAYGFPWLMVQLATPNRLEIGTLEQVLRFIWTIIIVVPLSWVAYEHP
jgi:hypothetical protein